MESLTLANISTLLIIISSIGGFIWQVITFHTKSAVSDEKINHLEKAIATQEKNLHDFEQQMLHYADRIETKLDAFILSKQESE